jgi:hypothetical protein
MNWDEIQQNEATRISALGKKFGRAIYFDTILLSLSFS